MSLKQTKQTKPSLIRDSGNKILLITGMSGAGKSRAVMALEDMGYFCVDNLPPALFVKLVEGMRLSNQNLPRMAIVADIRGGASVLPEVEAGLAELRANGIDVRILFLEATDAAIVRRYKENRRPHPLAKENSTITECIKEERQLLSNLRGQADVIIDTTDLKPQTLAEHLAALFGADSDVPGIHISIISFGFKHGIPIDADMVVDVRFLPNPFYVPELKNLTGLDSRVADYVLHNPITAEYLQRYMDLMLFLMPHYQHEGKKNFMLAIGCTGGCHRSVALAEAIGASFRSHGYASVSVSHRDMERMQ